MTETAHATKTERNERLANALAEARLTYEDVARAVRRAAAAQGVELRTNRSAVAHWVAGKIPKPETAAYLCEVVGAALRRHTTPADLGLTDPPATSSAVPSSGNEGNTLTMLDDLWRADLERRRFLTTAAYTLAATALPIDTAYAATSTIAHANATGAVAGPGEVEAVRTMVDMFITLDERFGGQHGRAALVQYLRNDVATLLRGSFRSDADHKAMLSAAATGVHLAGFKAYDATEHGLAQRYYRYAFDLAQESGMPGHDAYLLRAAATQAIKLGPARNALDLADASVVRVHGKIAPQVEAIFTVVRAHAHAVNGNTSAAWSDIDTSYELLSRPPGDQPPYWSVIPWNCEATVEARAAKAMAALGAWDKASAQYAASTSRWTSDYNRVRALNLHDQAQMEINQGHFDLACGLWHQALDAMGQVDSARTRKAAKDMRSSLAAFKGRGISAVTELDERAATYLSA